MTAPDRHLTLAMARAWPQLERLAALVGVLLGAAGRAQLSREARIGALRLLRPAEALVRRLIVLMARQMTVKAAPAVSGPVDPNCEAGKRDRSPKPRFRLFEPLPSLASVFADPETGTPAPLLTTALYERFSSRGEAEFANQLLSAMRYQFGGHREKTE